jgi:hypothetical protein
MGVTAASPRQIDERGRVAVARAPLVVVCAAVIAL